MVHDPTSAADLGRLDVNSFDAVICLQPCGGSEADDSRLLVSLLSLQQAAHAAAKGNTPPHTFTRKNEEFWPFTEADLKMEMAKRFLTGKMPSLQQMNNPTREKPKDDIDSLHDEM